MSLLDRLYDRIEVFRLEQRYMRRRNRDTTPKAQYVDGEYVYTPTASYSAKCSGGNSDTEADTKEAENKSMPSRRLSMFGLDKMNWKKTREEKRRSHAPERELKWD